MYAQRSLLTIITKMQKKFELRWGTGEPGTIFREHESRGPQRIRKGRNIEV